ncbi:MAG: hypothetical protein CM15mP127_07750 [Gammaproteobacteria bacterium]|nr:MAG: hypothetical protein CM15mP127_07750 [Gammaproteobacteria bacterium]
MKKNFFILDAPIKNLDLLIRTGGEMRLSNFYCSQHIQSLFFSEKILGRFSKKNFFNCIDSFFSRGRRKEFLKIFSKGPQAV